MKLGNWRFSNNGQLWRWITSHLCTFLYQKPHKLLWIPNRMFLSQYSLKKVWLFLDFCQELYTQIKYIARVLALVIPTFICATTSISDCPGEIFYKMIHRWHVSSFQATFTLNDQLTNIKFVWKNLRWQNWYPQKTTPFYYGLQKTYFHWFVY